ncbi:MAG: sigma 54-interacting transcriptional regulator [Deltaproteobacteria bacterium]|nr:sigma 54-interacting transcriptional regulator [Deltaproteobacteria bacterium]
MPTEPTDAKPTTALECADQIAELEAVISDLRGMVENSYDALAIIDGESRLLLVNPAFERIMGLRKADVVGRTTADMVRDGVTDTAASLKVLESGKQESVIINTIAGRQVLSTGVPVFDQDGKIHRIYCNLRDITGLNELKQRFEQSQRLLSKYLLELNEVKQQQVTETRFVAHDPEMLGIVETVYRVGRVDATVLLLGESGVGKELLARMVHDASPRRDTGSFVKINCGAIPGELLESELFGYEPGAFTGASKEGKPGYFEIADRGTLFLDEVGDLPLKLQVKLLSVLQDQEVTRVGGTKPKRIDVRIVAATNRDLEKRVRAGEFREDLFYRLNVVPVTVPPLRERRDDVGFLLVHFLERYNKKYGRSCRLSGEAVETLCAYRWPGNVRELANLVERLVVVCDAPVIGPEHLPRKYQQDAPADPSAPEKIASLREEVERYELSLIRREVARARNLEEAALRLGVSLSTLTRRLRLVRRDAQL